MSIVNCFSSKHDSSFKKYPTYEFTFAITGMFGGIRIILLMTHLSVDPACNTSLLVNKLVERFILRFAGGNPRQGVRRLHSLCIHRARLLFGSCQVELWLVGMELRSMCGESLACLHPPPPHGQWAVSVVQIDSGSCETFL